MSSPATVSPVLTGPSEPPLTRHDGKADASLSHLCRDVVTRLGHTSGHRNGKDHEPAAVDGIRPSRRYESRAADQPTRARTRGVRASQAPAGTAVHHPPRPLCNDPGGGRGREDACESQCYVVVDLAFRLLGQVARSCKASAYRRFDMFGGSAGQLVTNAASVAGIRSSIAGI
jgi:hypothetical protein